MRTASRREPAEPEGGAALPVPYLSERPTLFRAPLDGRPRAWRPAEKPLGGWSTWVFWPTVFWLLIAYGFHVWSVGLIVAWAFILGSLQEWTDSRLLVVTTGPSGLGIRRRGKIGAVPWEEIRSVTVEGCSLRLELPQPVTLDLQAFSPEDRQALADVIRVRVAEAQTPRVLEGGSEKADGE